MWKDLTWDPETINSLASNRRVSFVTWTPSTGRKAAFQAMRQVNWIREAMGQNSGRASRRFMGTDWSPSESSGNKEQQRTGSRCVFWHVGDPACWKLKEMLCKKNVNFKNIAFFNLIFLEREMNTIIWCQGWIYWSGWETLQIIRCRVREEVC